MMKASKDSALGVLIQAIEECQSLDPESRPEHFTRMGMPEVAHWLLRCNWESQGKKVGTALRDLHLHEWSQGFWPQAMNRLAALNRSECEIDGKIDVAGNVVKALAQLEHLKVHWLELELKADAVRFARVLCNLRPTDTKAYHLLREWMLVRKPWEKQPNALTRAALRLAVEYYHGGDEQAFEDLEVLLSQRHIRRITPFFRFRFQSNIACLRRFTTARLQRAGPFGGMSDHAVFSWFVLVWVYCGNMWPELCYAALQGDMSLQPPNTPIGAVMRAAQAYQMRSTTLQSTILPSDPTSTTPRLKVALCVFGQLRNFSSAHKTWGVLGLARHDVSTFVHTWGHTGMRVPCAESGAGTERVFSHPPFVRAYRRAGFLYGNAAIRARYPRLHASLVCGGEVNLSHLRSVYGSDAEYVVEDDPGDDFGPDPLNQRRMFRKMRGVIKMMQESGESFDLCVLIRPDLLLEAENGELDLNLLAARTRSSPMVYGGLVVTGNLFMEDAYAIGDPSVISAIVDVEAFTNEKSWMAPHTLVPHTSIAFNAFAKGVGPVLHGGVRKKGFASEVCLDRQQIRTLLLEDLPNGTQNDMDRLLFASVD